MKVFLAGNMARDAAMADRLVQEGCELHVAADFRNPSLIDAVIRSDGGFYDLLIEGSDVTDPEIIVDAVGISGAELFVTNSDEALANGVVDAIAEEFPRMLIASPTRESARIEWDKFDARNIIQDLDEARGTSYNPRYIRVNESQELQPAIQTLAEAGVEIVVKPRGLTGGKGVKVMGPHLEDYAAVSRYALEVLHDPSQDGLLLEEKLKGHEFTIQGFTDGKTLAAPPVTYDYPYREDGDTGPGTGGMGSFTMPPGEQLPFLSDGDYKEALELMRDVLDRQRELGRDFKGVLYGSFFKTADGIKVVEFNARMGDPEGLNIIDLLTEETPLIDVLSAIAQGELTDEMVCYAKLASTAIYLVAPEYGYNKNGSHEFTVDRDKVAVAGCRVYFGAAKLLDTDYYQSASEYYQTVGSSRTLALTSLGPTPWEARDNIHQAISQSFYGPLQYRRDVGDREYIQLDLRPGLD